MDTVHDEYPAYPADGGGVEMQPVAADVSGLEAPVDGFDAQGDDQAYLDQQYADDAAAAADADAAAAAAEGHDGFEDVPPGVDGQDAFEDGFEGGEGDAQAIDAGFGEDHHQWDGGDDEAAAAAAAAAAAGGEGEGEGGGQYEPGFQGDPDSYSQPQVEDQETLEQLRHMKSVEEEAKERRKKDKKDKKDKKGKRKSRHEDGEDEDEEDEAAAGDDGRIGGPSASPGYDDDTRGLTMRGDSPLSPRSKRQRWSYVKWMAAIAEEIAFTTWFRVYILLQLYCVFVFDFLLGYHYMLSASYRMVVPPYGESSQFFVSSAFLLLFFLTLTLAATFVTHNGRLVLSWLGMSRASCNVFYLPNRYHTESRALLFRNFQLLVLEIATLFLPVVYAVIVCGMNGESVLTVPGHFSYCSFLSFHLCTVLIWLYFWWRAVRQKSKAWRLGTLASRETRRELRDRGDDDDDADPDRRSKRKDRRRRGRDGSESEGDSTDSEEQYRRRRRRRRDDKRPVPWKKHILANPEVMSEFGGDLYSMQAYLVHVVLGVAWVVLSVYPIGLEISKVQWLVILIFTVVLTLSTLLLQVSKTKANKTAKRQRKAAWGMLITIGIFLLLGFIGAIATIPELGAVVLAGILLTQFMMVRRHDMHVRDPDEAGYMYLPLLDDVNKEARDREDMGSPPVAIPLIPLANILKSCFSCKSWLEHEVIDTEGNKLLFARMDMRKPGSSPGHARLTELKRRHTSMAERDGALDKIIRPTEQPHFKPFGAESAFVTNRKGQEKLVREERLNKRERVLTADAMVLTWYLALFLIVIGMAHGYGDWMKPLASGGAVKVEPYAGGAVYPACSMRWGSPSSELSLQDLALLNYMVDESNGGVRRAAEEAWFRKKDKIVYEVATNMTRSPGYGAPVFYREYYGWSDHTKGPKWRSEATGGNPAPAFGPADELMTGEADEIPAPEYMVVVVGGTTKHGTAWMRDIDAFFDATFYQFLSALNPFFCLWHLDDQKSFVKAVASLKKVFKKNGEDDAVDRLYKHVVELKTLHPGVPVVVTGYGFSGGWAKVIAHKYKEDKHGIVPVVAFGSPGTLWTGGKYGAPHSEHVDEVSVNPSAGALSWIDRQTGFVQETECDSGLSMTKCQRMKNMLCGVLRDCGDVDGRTVAGFNGGSCKF